MNSSALKSLIFLAFIQFNCMTVNGEASTASMGQSTSNVSISNQSAATKESVKPSETSLSPTSQQLTSQTTQESTYETTRESTYETTRESTYETTRESTYETTRESVSPTTGPKGEPPLPKFDPPNYRYKVLKHTIHSSAEYAISSIFIAVALIIIAVTAVWQWKEGQQKQREIASGARYKPNKKKRAESSIKSANSVDMSPSNSPQ